MQQDRLRIAQELKEAMEQVREQDADKDDEIGVLAAYFFDVAKGRGLSPITEDVSSVERPALPQWAVDLVSRVLGHENALFDEERLGDQIYFALEAVSDNSGLRALVNKMKPPTREEIMELGQIYWNLEATERRHRLPLKPSGDFVIKIHRANDDFARKSWTERSKVGPPGMRGNSFRTKGARLAVIVAAELTHKSGESGAAELVQNMQGEANNSDKSHVPAGKSLETTSSTSANYEPSRDVEAEVRALFLKDMARQMQRRSLADPGGDDEQELPGILYGAGIHASGNEARQFLEDARRSVETWVALQPGAMQYQDQRLDIVMALAEVNCSSGNYERASQLFEEAEQLAQELADTDPVFDSRLLTVLGRYGEFLYRTADTVGATERLTRAVRIGRRLSDMSADDHSIVWVLARSLHQLGLIHRDQGERRMSMEFWMEARSVISLREPRVGHSNLAQEVFFEVTVSLSKLANEEKRWEDELHAIKEAVGIARQVREGLPNDENWRFRHAVMLGMLGQAQLVRAMTQQTSGDADIDLSDAESALVESNEILVQLSPNRSVLDQLRTNLASRVEISMHESRTAETSELKEQLAYVVRQLDEDAI